MLSFPEKISDPVISHFVEPCSQAFDPSDVPESYRELVEDILQNILSLLTVLESSSLYNRADVCARYPRLR